QREHQRLLGGKVLVQRADAHPGALRHLVGGELVVAGIAQNVSSCSQNGVDGDLGPLLLGTFSGGLENASTKSERLLVLCCHGNRAEGRGGGAPLSRVAVPGLVAGGAERPAQALHQSLAARR